MCIANYPNLTSSNTSLAVNNDRIINKCRFLLSTLKNSKIHFWLFDHVFYFYFSSFKIEGILIFIFVQISFECTITILNKFSVKKSEPNKEKQKKKKNKKEEK